MPDLTAQASIFRSGRFRYTGFLSTISQTVIFSRAVNMATITYPVRTITFDDPYTGVGAFGDVQDDMTVLVYSGNTTTLKGRLRVASGAATSTVLQISEFARGVVDLANNDRFDVVREWRIQDKLVEAAAALRKDSRLTYTDQGSNPNPVCNSGGPIVGFISGASLSANFYGATSFTVDPDSAGTGTHAWAFGDGTPTSDTVADPAGVTFPAGFRFISHTFTDSTNSKSTTQRVPVWAHERTGANAPLSIQMESRSYANGYWTARFRLPKESQSSVTTLPDGAMVVYWEEEYYNTTQASYGLNVSNRSHVKFVGYLLRDTITIDPDRNEVVFEAVGPLGILESTPALPQLILSKASPANWQQVKTLTVNRILWYLLYWHTAFNTICDFVWVSGSDLSYARIAIDSIDSIAGQLRDVAASINVQATCDRLGRLLLIRDPNYLSSSDRSARTTAYNLTTADLNGVDITREHRASYKFVRGEGIMASASIATMSPVFSNGPGNAPAAYGIGTETLSKQIVASQTDMNNRTGWHFARINGLNDGLFVPKAARFTFRGAYDWLEPAYLEWLTLTLASTTNKRGVSYTTDTRWVADNMDVSYDPATGLKEVAVALSYETDGPAGVTYVPPAANNLGDFTGLDINFDFGDFSVAGLELYTLRPGLLTLAAFDATGLLWITNDFETPEASGGPTWVSTNLTALANWAGSVLSGFAVDAFSPKYLGTGTTVNGWLWSDTRWMRITDIFGAVALTSLGDFRATSTRRSGNFERGLQNWGIVVTWYTSDGIWASYTTNGTSFSEIQVNVNYDTGANTWLPGIWLDPHLAGRGITSVFTNTDTYNNLTTDGYFTTDYGATWAAISNPDITPGQAPAATIAVPFQITNGGTVLYGRFQGSTGAVDRRIYRSVGTVITDISPLVSGNRYGVVGYNRSLAVSDTDKNVAVLCGLNDINTLAGVWSTPNVLAAAPTWTALVAPIAAGSMPYNAVYIAGQVIYLIGSLNALSIGRVDSTVLDSRKGNMDSGGVTIGICGG